jgi:hypothetical protein
MSPFKYLLFVAISVLYGLMDEKSLISSHIFSLNFLSALSSLLDVKCLAQPSSSRLSHQSLFPIAFNSNALLSSFVQYILLHGQTTVIIPL